MNQRYFIKLSYNGNAFHGWQVQKNAKTIQLVLNQALSHLLHTPIETMGAGRTDTGVHAREFYAHFDHTKHLSKEVTQNLIFKLNRYLPEAIAIHDIIPVKTDAHARFSATSRTYQYIITRNKDPFNSEFSYYLYGDLNIGMMNKAAKMLVQENDFSCFCKSNTQVNNFICKIISAKWKKDGGQLVFTIEANRFLRNMVRAIVGTLIEIGQEKFSIQDLKKIIESKNRSAAGYSVPAQGLFLTKIKYPKNIWL